MPEDTPGAAPEKVGERTTRAETTTRRFDADGKLASETTWVEVTYVADDKPFPEGGYL